MFWERLKNIIKIKLQSIGESPEDKGTRKQRYKRRSEQFSESQTTQSKESKYFKLLEMEPSDDLDQIKSQYRKLIRKYHPDKHNMAEDKRQAAEKLTIALNEAMDYFEGKLKIKN